jgi:hypothetical protein
MTRTLRTTLAETYFAKSKPPLIFQKIYGIIENIIGDNSISGVSIK